jgi:hypothetical protein
LRRRLDRAFDFATAIPYASALRNVGEPTLAANVLQTAVKLNPERPEGWNNLAQCYTDMGRFDQAPMLFQRALQCFDKQGLPIEQTGETLLGFAYSMMRLGQWKYVWPVWEGARCNRSWHPFPHLQPWRGEPVARLLVLPEGGFGDGFMFSRWLPALLDRVPAVTLLLWDPLFEYANYVVQRGAQRSILGRIRVLPMSHEFQYDELAEYTHCTPLMSLPAHANMQSWNDIPPSLDWSPRGRIIAPPQDWIGFCWRAEENGVARKIRTLDHAAAGHLSKWLSKRCERLVSLCPTGKALYRQGDESVPAGVVQDEAAIDGWEPTARTLLKCKHVVTADTAVAHLAGALGVPTTILLPLRSMWTWSVESECGDRTHWYGSNCRVFRNTAVASWDLEGIKKALCFL